VYFASTCGTRSQLGSESVWAFLDLSGSRYLANTTQQPPPISLVVRRTARILHQHQLLLSVPVDAVNIGLSAADGGVDATFCRSARGS